MKDRYGINITKWCKEHECEVDGFLKNDHGNDGLQQMLEKHEKKLQWLMHERLIHLIVLLLTVMLLIFSITLLICAPDTMPASLPLTIIVFILVCFYVKHYFFLENTVQKWYKLDEEITGRIES